eukprot:m.234937 g.234937  ORF g.234937 m.234937 type:complete len:55 (+) comp15258_c2_seq2:875-1039(+)
MGRARGMFDSKTELNRNTKPGIRAVDSLMPQQTPILIYSNPISPNSCTDLHVAT